MRVFFLPHKKLMGICISITSEVRIGHWLPEPKTSVRAAMGVQGSEEPLEDAQAGKTITTQVEILLDPVVKFETFELILKQGSIGNANLRFYTVPDVVEYTIQEINHYDTNDGTGTNPPEISLSFYLIE
jgi:hypothetical protein